MILDAKLGRKIQTAKRALERAERAKQKARSTYYRTIADCARAGASMRAIAEAVGLSHQRVHQMLHTGCDFCATTYRDAGSMVAGSYLGARGTYGHICDRCLDVAERVVRSGRAARKGDQRIVKLPPGSPARCNFCGKRAREVAGVAQHADVRICDECLVRCRQILGDGSAGKGRSRKR